MPTKRQDLGQFGEKIVSQLCTCPRCKRSKTLKRLPTNFKCADLICDFCGFLGQVKASTALDVSEVPRQLLGAAWGPQRERMEAGIYFPLYLVLVTEDRKSYAISICSHQSCSHLGSHWDLMQDELAGADSSTNCTVCRKDLFGWCEAVSKKGWPVDWYWRRVRPPENDVSINDRLMILF